VRLVDQWREIERSLPEDWGDARLRLTIGDARKADRAASLLGPINPGRRGNVLRFETARRGAGPSPNTVARLLAGLDSEGVRGELEVVGSEVARTQPETARPTLAAAWDEALVALPADWSDIYAEIALVSTDWLERAALLLAPLNPARHGARPAFRFRVARQFGYGASAEMMRRCVERLDQAGIRGRLQILRVLSDTAPVATQGPVWYVEGRSV
jgi:hypothetical protein